MRPTPNSFPSETNDRDSGISNILTGRAIRVRQALRRGNADILPGDEVPDASVMLEMLEAVSHHLLDSATFARRAVPVDQQKTLCSAKAMTREGDIEPIAGLIHRGASTLEIDRCDTGSLWWSRRKESLAVRALLHLIVNVLTAGGTNHSTRSGLETYFAQAQKTKGIHHVRNQTHLTRQAR
jgi:hypothetical protein